MAKILVTVPNLKTPGGVSSFWNALLPEFHLKKDLKVTPLEIGGHGKNPLGPFLDQWKLMSSLKKVDLVVLNPSLGGRSFFRDGLFAKQLAVRNRKFVVFFHGWDLDFERKVTKSYVGFFKGSFAKAEQIFVLSKDFETKLREWGYTGKISIATTTIERGLIAGFSIKDKSEHIRNSGKLRILFMSRLVKEKGIYETIEAFRKLQLSFPNTELFIAGDGAEMEMVANETKNDADIVLLGHVEGDKKRDLLMKSHVYCLPSYTEGLPTSVLEAMAFGMPVITTAVGGLKYFFKDKEMGYFVDLKKKEDMVHRLKDLISDTEKMVTIGTNNHGYALNYLTSDKVAHRLAESFNNIIGRP